MDAFELVHFECDNSVKILPNVTIKFFIGSSEKLDEKKVQYVTLPFLFFPKKISYHGL